MFKHGQFRHSEMQKTCLREKKKKKKTRDFKSNEQLCFKGVLWIF